jgi:hypothetical protein
MFYLEHLILETPNLYKLAVINPIQGDLNMRKASKIGLIAGAGLAGIITGICATKGVLSWAGNVAEEARIFSMGWRQPKVMRVYKPGNDEILVQNPRNKNDYLPLKDYMRTLPMSERDVFEASARRAAGWYEGQEQQPKK